MKKIENIGHYNKETGEEITVEMLASIEKEEFTKTKLSLIKRFEKEPLSLSLEEIIFYRKYVLNKRSEDVEFRYENGDFVLSCIKNKKIIKELSLETSGLLHKLTVYINKYGVIKYNNGRPIKSFEKIREEFEISDRKWRNIMKEISSLEIIKKIKDERDGLCLVVNPMYMSSSYSVDSLRFLTFGKVLKSFLPPIDFILLCKKYDIIPED